MRGPLTAEERAMIAGAKLVGHSDNCALVKDVEAAECTCQIGKRCTQKAPKAAGAQSMETGGKP